MSIPRDKASVLADLLDTEEALLRIQRQRLFFRLFPDDGPRSRLLYPKHMTFFGAGATYRERCFMAANRVGKTVAGGYEVACHLTGLYPDWWGGRRFYRPVRAWIAGRTNETTRDIVQRKLFGKVIRQGLSRSLSGEGIVPGSCLGDVTWKQGVQDLADKIAVRHVSGGWSEVGVKSYQQGRGAFEGTEQDVIWCDEEPPADIYGECLIRTATTNGLIMLTFTPLEGLSDVVMSFMPQEMRLGDKP
jgi:phage terminase large subunit-like protein